MPKYDMHEMIKNIKDKDDLYKLFRIDYMELPDEQANIIYTWIKTTAREFLPSYEYCCLLGWMVFDDSTMAISPKDAGIYD